MHPIEGQTIPETGTAPIVATGVFVCLPACLPACLRVCLCVWFCQQCTQPASHGHPTPVTPSTRTLTPNTHTHPPTYIYNSQVRPRWPGRRSLLPKLSKVKTISMGPPTRTWGLTQPMKSPRKQTTQSWSKRPRLRVFLHVRAHARMHTHLSAYMLRW